MAKNLIFHKKPFDKGTKTKVELFDAYLNESLPVFIHQKYWSDIFIYDLFAGKGLDENGEYGTALNILKGVSRHCVAIVKNKKNLYVVLNDKEEKDSLQQNVNAFLEDCKSRCEAPQCVFDKNNLIVKSNDFKEYFNDTIYPRLQNRPDAMKLIFLDPFNFVMDNEVFNKLTSLPKTDFMCFIPTTYLRRFPTEPTFKKFIEEYGLMFSQTKYNHSHRIIADYIRKLVPPDKEYYIGHFSIEKPQKTGTGKNYYGIIFGSNNTLGAEKFQKVCWKIDPQIGEADYNIDNEPTYGGNQDLFNEIPLKIKAFNDDLKKLIVDAKITTDLECYRYALQKCLQPKHASTVLNKLMETKRIQEFKTVNSDIHKIKNPIKIELL
ncbi:MAG: three-Cys-motif partner protein TcmP [Bacteroidales bacterium]|nr:three-Cys-motif partner protein TcmP [Bacteroidales bacterium]